MTPGSGSPAGLLRKAEFEPASALAEYRKVLSQRLLEGVSGDGRALPTIDPGSMMG